MHRPQEKFKTATVVSSVSISWAKAPYRPITERTGPAIHCRRSTVCTPWFIRDPPPSKAQVPFQLP